MPCTSPCPRRPRRSPGSWRGCPPWAGRGTSPWPPREPPDRGSRANTARGRERARRLAVALDLVYAPGGTRWVRTLRAAGVRAQDGREVLVHQGAAAFGRFFPDRAAPVEVMRAAVDRALRA